MTQLVYDVTVQFCEKVFDHSPVLKRWDACTRPSLRTANILPPLEGTLCVGSTQYPAMNGRAIVSGRSLRTVTDKTSAL
jgi:hypothetical protein